MENDVFSFNRFWRYLKSDFDAFVSRYGITLLVTGAMPVSCEVFSGVLSLMNMGKWQGMEINSRLGLFVLFGIIMLINAPSRLYGHITDRKEGSTFLLLPVSRLEKYISMILITCIVLPFMYILIYMGLDVMVCMFDPTCDVSLFTYMYSYEEFSRTGLGSQNQVLQSVLNNNFGSILSPLYFIDDIIRVSLVFLLGALVFKTSKTGKTLGCAILISMLFKLALAPVIASFANVESLYQFGNSGHLDISSEAFRSVFPLNAWIWKHLVLIDTVWDITVDCILLLLIWLRLKKINH